MRIIRDFECSLTETIVLEKGDKIEVLDDELVVVLHPNVAFEITAKSVR